MKHIENLHEEMQRLDVSLIVSDSLRYTNPGALVGSPLSEMVWEGRSTSFVCWEHRAVAVEWGLIDYQHGRLIHEVVHAIYSDPPERMDSESFTWMYAAEYALARRWDRLGHWLLYMRDTPVDHESGNQTLWSWHDDAEHETFLKGWRALLREEGFMRHNHFIPPGRWPGQVTTTLPRGFYNLTEKKDSYTLTRST